MATMYPIDEVVRAADLISSTIAEIETQELLCHHRQALQSAFESLGRILRSRAQQTQQQSNPFDYNQGISEKLASASVHQSPTTLGSAEDDEVRAPAEDGEVRAPAEDGEVRAPAEDGEVRAPAEDGEVRAPAEDGEVRAPAEDGEVRAPAEDGEVRAPAEDDEVTELIGTLQRESEKIHAFTNKAEKDAVSEGNWTGSDPRHVDIQLSKCGSSWTRKFRGWLARYSFANEYLNWAQTKYEKPRDQFLILDAKDADHRGKGGKSHVSEFMEVINDKAESTRKAIQYGLKYHSFEHVYGSRGPSAFLFGVFSAFRRFSYPNMPALAHSIHQSSTWSTMADRKADWVSRCLLIYNENCEEYIRQMGLKRRLYSEGLEQSQSKRPEVTFVPTTAFERDNGSQASQVATLDIAAVSEAPSTANLPNQFSTGDGYDPFQVDFNYLLRELDNQNPEISLNVLSFTGRDNEERPDGYDPFLVDFNFIHQELNC